MVLHKFALLGGKVPAATGMRAAGRPPKAGRRTSFAAAAAPPGLRPAGCSPENPAPPGAAVFGLFLSEGVRFLRLMFFRRLRTFCGRDRTDCPSPARANQWIDFIHPRRLSIFGLLRWGGIVPIPARKSNRIVFIHPCRLSILGFAVGKNSPHPPARARQTDGFFIPYRPVLPTAG